MTFELKLRDAWRDGRNEGFAEGQLASVKALMVNLRVTAKQAPDYMGIPADEQEKYLQALQVS